MRTTKQLIEDWVLDNFGESELDDPSWNIDLLAEYIDSKGEIESDYELLPQLQDFRKKVEKLRDFWDWDFVRPKNSDYYLDSKLSYVRDKIEHLEKYLLECSIMVVRNELDLIIKANPQYFGTKTSDDFINAYSDGKKLPYRETPSIEVAVRIDSLLCYLD